VTVTARFTGPVSDAKAQLGTRSLDLTPVAGQPHTYRGSVNPTAVETGDLTITFEPERDRPPLPVPPEPGPGGLPDRPATIVLQPPVVTGGVISQTFTAKTPRFGPRAQVTGTLEIEKLPGYTPSAEDAAEASRSGVLAYGSVLSALDPRITLGLNGRWSATGGTIVDLDWLAARPTRSCGRP
jgi:hypothetical protein